MVRHNDAQVIAGSLPRRDRRQAQDGGWLDGTDKMTQAATSPPPSAFTFAKSCARPSARRKAPNMEKFHRALRSAAALQGCRASAECAQSHPSGGTDEPAMIVTSACRRSRCRARSFGRDRRRRSAGASSKSITRSRSSAADAGVAANPMRWGRSGTAPDARRHRRRGCLRNPAGAGDRACRPHSESAPAAVRRVPPPPPERPRRP